MTQHGPHVCGELKTLIPICSAWKLTVVWTAPLNRASAQWLTDIIYVISTSCTWFKQEAAVTGTSSPCSRLLCCTRPSICGTYLKPSPLNQALSGTWKQNSCSRQRYTSLIKKNMFTVLQWVLTLYNCRTWFSRNTLVSVYSLSPKGSGYATHKA